MLATLESEKAALEARVDELSSGSLTSPGDDGGMSEMVQLSTIKSLQNN